VKNKIGVIADIKRFHSLAQRKVRQ
jgi:hypothetical protein